MKLAEQFLPKSSVCYEVISVDTALEVVNRLRETNHSQDEQLAALLWLFPKNEIEALAPGYLLPVIDALPGLWENILLQLSRLGDESQSVSLPQAPAVAKSIAATYLFILNEHGCRQIYRSPDRSAGIVSIKEFLGNFLDLARQLAFQSPDTAADHLIGSVRNSIQQAALVSDLLPESTRVWAITAKANPLVANAKEILTKLESFVRRFWLTTGRFPVDHEMTDKIFYVRLKEDPNEANFAIDRLMASLAIHFSTLFVIRKERFSDSMKSVVWSRTAVWSWGMGLGYSGRYQRLLKSQNADPLTEFMRFNDSESELTHLELLNKLRVSP